MKSGKYPGVLYTDKTLASKEMQDLLDSAGAKYTVADARKEALPGPVFIVKGSFLDVRSLKEVLTSV